MTPRRVRTGAAVFLVASLFATLGSLIGWAIPFDANSKIAAPDFLAHVAAGRMVAAGHATELFSDTAQRQAQQEILAQPGPGDFFDAYLSPPFVAYLYAPLATLPYRSAVLVWTFLTAAALAAALWLLWPLLPGLHRHGFATFALVALSIQPVMDLLGSGQDSAFALLLLVAGLRLLLAARDTWAGLVLGLGAFKPQLFLLIPVLLLVHRRWRAFGVGLVTVALLAVGSAAAIGQPGVRAYLDLLTGPLYQQQIASAWSWKMISLPAFLRAIGPGLSPALITGASAVVLIAAAIRLGRAPSAGSSEPRRLAGAFGWAVLGTVVATPHVFLYDGVVLLLPLALFLAAAPADRRRRLAIACLYLLFWTTPLRHLAVLSLHLPASPLPSLLGAPWIAPALALLFVTGGTSARDSDSARASDEPDAPRAGTWGDKAPPSSQLSAAVPALHPGTRRAKRRGDSWSPTESPPAPKPLHHKA